MGGSIEFPGNGATVPGYLAAGEGAGLGVIVIPPRWGLVPHILEVCDRLAAEGFTALAPDLSSGGAIEDSEPDQATRASLALDAPRAARHLSGAVDFLVEHPSVRGHGLAVVGFCAGGGLALWLGCLRPDQVRAVVPFDGFIAPSQAQPDWSRFEAAVEAHYGEDDDQATLEAVRAVEQELASRNREVRLFSYPGVGHAFFDDTRPETYDEDAARQAWVRTLEFLRAKLG